MRAALKDNGVSVLTEGSSTDQGNVYLSTTSFGIYGQQTGVKVFVALPPGFRRSASVRLSARNGRHNVGARCRKPAPSANYCSAEVRGAPGGSNHLYVSVGGTPSSPVSFHYFVVLFYPR
jgi:hypothetical protein